MPKEGNTGKAFRVRHVKRQYLFETQDGKDWVHSMTVLDKGIVKKMVEDLKRKGCSVKEEY